MNARINEVMVDGLWSRKSGSFLDKALESEVVLSQNGEQCESDFTVNFLSTTPGPQMAGGGFLEHHSERRRRWRLMLIPT